MSSLVYLLALHIVIRQIPDGSSLEFLVVTIQLRTSLIDVMSVLIAELVIAPTLAYRLRIVLHFASMNAYAIALPEYFTRGKGSRLWVKITSA